VARRLRKYGLIFVRYLVRQHNNIDDCRGFGSWTTNSNKVLYPEATIGKAHTILGKGRWQGEVRTLLLKKMTVLHKNELQRNILYYLSWSFKDTEGGTKVTWQSKGNMSFLLKFYTALNGGVEEVIEMYEKSLANLDKALDYEINTFSIKMNGLVKNHKVLFSPNIYKQLVKSIKY
jgi:hypothetical protein